MDAVARRSALKGPNVASLETALGARDKMVLILMEGGESEGLGDRRRVSGAGDILHRPSDSTGIKD
jgi:hypothetical protein